MNERWHRQAEHEAGLAMTGEEIVRKEERLKS